MAVISFDLDGVLQKNPFRSSRPDGVFGHIRREFAPYVRSAGDPELAALDLVHGEHQRRMYAGLLVEAHDWDGVVAEVARQVGYPRHLDVAELVTQYCEKPGLIYLYPGGHECLKALVDAGHTLVTITNGFRSYQEPVIRKLGVYPYFTAMVTPEKAGAAKPQAGIFRAAEAHGAGPYIHIGDTLPHDVAGANRAGWKSIYIVQPGAPGATDLPHDLAALPPHERPAAGRAWLAERLTIDRKWHGYPPCELHECIPGAIVHSLFEVPAAVAALLR